ncbi:hypothetical protein [Paraurantiacibacter namhicola]|uniref:Uncharacterized protein n=1 Tax=Paraurantiacibacter namhicola TaxID=645517 RepID=A0A1C7D6X9_9SPHN|nr:hypothetical protein A6F65_00920 [Paraurantiacibacter namhicola]
MTVREEDRTIEMPAIQAVFRAIGKSAMKGNRFAQKTLAELVTSVEAVDHESSVALFGTAVEYKLAWSQEIERCEKDGIEPPRPVPHPANIILDPASGKVRFEGPQTKEQREQLEACLARRDEAQEEVSYIAEKYRPSRSEKMRALYLDGWHWEQRMFDIINNAVPRRYKANLENRSYRDGASRSGHALVELAKDKRMRGEYLGESHSEEP